MFKIARKKKKKIHYVISYYIECKKTKKIYSCINKVIKEKQKKGFMYLFYKIT